MCWRTTWHTSHVTAQRLDRIEKRREREEKIRKEMKVDQARQSLDPYDSPHKIHHTYTFIPLAVNQPPL